MAMSTDKLTSLLYRLPRVGLNNIADLPGAKKKAIRVGRGPGSRRGKTCGRGHKGQGQRGTRPRVGFEGGQTPFYLRIPKHGFNNNFRREYEPLNLSKLQLWIDSGRIDANGPINMYTLHQAGVISRHVKHGVKLLGGGAEWFQSKIDIEVSCASKSAIDAVEKRGGRIVSAHYNKLGLRVLLKPEKFEGRALPRRALPSNELLPYYMDYTNRGYLSEELADLETRERVLGITNRKKLPRRPKGWQAIESEKIAENFNVVQNSVAVPEIETTV